MSFRLLGVLAYVALQLVLGFVVSRRVRTESDYLVAGRRLGMPLTTFSVFATWFGAETCIGATAQAYGQGLAGVTADPFGYALCLLVMGLVLAVPLWRRKLATLGDLFRTRYGAAAERIVVLLLVPTSVMWAGAQIRAFGQVLGASSELTLATTITIAAAVVIFYTAMGGMLADAVSDIVQGVVLICGLLLLLFMMIQSGDLQTAERVGAPLLHTADSSWLDRLEAWTVPVVGSLVSQELIGRVVAAREPKIARRATLVAAALYLALGSIPVWVGLVAARVRPGVSEPEQVLVLQAAHYLPQLGQVVFTGALVSAILSTVDSALLAAGSLTAHNLLIPLRPHLSEAQKLRLNRTAVVFFGLVAYGLALSTEGVYSLVEEASAFGTAGVVICLFLGLFTRFGGQRAAVCSLLLGFASYLVTSHLLHAPHPYLISLLLAALGYGAGMWLERSA